MKWKEYLDTLEKHGYKAFVIGGFVRDKLLGLESYDIDIATEATPDQIKNIFNITTKDSYGSITFQEGKYSIDITTFRNEYNYQNRHPEVKFVKTLKEDVQRRDFTINSIAMDKNEKYYDYLEGIDDLKKRQIKSVGDPDTKFKEDPLRILRALRLAIIYDFTIEKRTFESIFKNKNLLKSLSFERRREEIDKILICKSSKKGLKWLKDIGILTILEIDCSSTFCQTDSLEAAWAELEFSTNYPFTKKERINIQNIKTILNKKTITTKDIFYYSQKTIEASAAILGIPRQEMQNMYNNMPIHSEKDLKLNGLEIKEILNSPKINIKNVKEDLINNILSGNLSNEFKYLKEYIIQKWK